MFHRFKLLQIQQLTFKQPEKVFNDRIIQTVAFTAHALPDILFLEHPLVLLMLVLPALVGVKDEVYVIWYLRKRLI